MGAPRDYHPRDELLDDLVPGTGFRLAGGDFHFATSRATFEGLVRLPHEVDRRPHLILRRWRTYFTSCALFLEKPVAPGTPPERCAPRGAEPPVGLPPSCAPGSATPPRRSPSLARGRTR